MQYLKKIKKYYLAFFIWFISLIILISILSYFNIISASFIKGLKIIIPILLISLNSFKSSKKVNIKGYLNGLLYSGLIITTLFLINILFFRTFYLKQSLYYIILILSSCFGSMLGKTKKSQLTN